MKDLEIANSILKHIGCKPSYLPEFLIDDKDHRNQLTQEDVKILAHFEEDSLWSLKTVRFLKDFYKYKAGYHEETTNKSFLRTAEIFRQMGIKNYYFHLQINNPLLRNVDPWDPNLTEEQKLMVLNECKENVWYCIREVIKIDGRRFIGNRAVISFIWACLNHLPTTIIMPRQSGKAQPLYSLIRMAYSGTWKLMKDINIGDMVLTPDGTPAPVIGIYPQGKKEVFKITFEDGRESLCCKEHLWKVDTGQDNDGWRVLTTEEIFKSNKNWVIPWVQPDQTSKNTNPAISHFEMGKKVCTGSVSNISDEYLQGSHDQRKQFLMGLIGITEETVIEEEFRVTVSNSALSDQIALLVRSLGCLAVVRKTNQGYQVVIDHSRINVLFGLETVIEDTDGLKIVSVESLNRDEEMQCIEIDHPDHLYITDNFVVTHNTVGMQVLAFIMQYIIGRGYRGGLITLAASNRMQFVQALKKIRAGLPEYIVNVTYKDKDAGNILSYQAYGQDKENTFEVKVPSGGEDGAENVSRGNTFEMLLYDEPAWTKYIENIINGAGPSTLTAQKNAREKGIPYFTAKATTPNSILKEEGKYMHDDFMNSTEWKEYFFDCFSETHLVNKIIKNSPIKTTYPKIGMMFNHLQLGFGKRWVKETMDKLGLSWSKAKIDLLMMWTEEGLNKLFDDFTREKLADCKIDHIWSEEILSTELYVNFFISKEQLESYKNDPDEYFLIGVDTSDANDRDACTVVIRRIKTGEVVGTGRYALAFLDDVTLVLKELLVNIPNSLLIIERNRAAHMIERLLIMLPALGIDPFKRIFNGIYQDPIKYKNEFQDVSEIHFKHRTKDFYLKYKRFFGFNTGPETRKQMYGFIFEAVSLTGSGIRYGLIVDELIGLQIDKDGRIDHKSGGHDDLVIAWLITYWFIKLGYNKTLYNVPQGNTLIEITSLKDSSDGPQYTQNQLAFFVSVKEQINLKTKDLMNASSNTIAERLEQEIVKLSNLIPKELRKSITIDEIIENAKSERNKRAIFNRGNGRSRRIIV